MGGFVQKVKDRFGTNRDPISSTKAMKVNSSITPVIIDQGSVNVEITDASPVNQNARIDQTAMVHTKCLIKCTRGKMEGLLQSEASIDLISEVAFADFIPREVQLNIANMESMMIVGEDSNTSITQMEDITKREILDTGQEAEKDHSAKREQTIMRPTNCSIKVRGVVMEELLESVNEQITKGEQTKWRHANYLSLVQRWLSLDGAVKKHSGTCLLLQTLSSSVHEARSTASQVIVQVASIEPRQKQWLALIAVVQGMNATEGSNYVYIAASWALYNEFLWDPGRFKQPEVAAEKVVWLQTTGVMKSPTWRLILGVLSIPSLVYLELLVLQRLCSRDDVAGEMDLWVERLEVRGEISIEESLANLSKHRSIVCTQNVFDGEYLISFFLAIKGLKEKLAEAMSRDEVKAVVLTGKNKRFSGGFDINVRQKVHKTGDISVLPSVSVDLVVNTIENAKKPILAAVEGLCLGGFVLPFARKLGYPVPPFDFSVQGVISISVDVHKYGPAPKGTSVVLYRNHDIQKNQFVAVTEWNGGLYVSPTIAGSRPGSLIAGAAMVFLGQEGYLENTREIMKASMKIVRSGVVPLLQKYHFFTEVDLLAYALLLCYIGNEFFYYVDIYTKGFGWLVLAKFLFIPGVLNSEFRSWWAEKFSLQEYDDSTLYLSTWDDMKNYVMYERQCGTAPSEDINISFLGNIYNTGTTDAAGQKLKDYGVDFGVGKLTLVTCPRRDGVSRRATSLPFSYHLEIIAKLPSAIMNKLGQKVELQIASPNGKVNQGNLHYGVMQIIIQKLSNSDETQLIMVPAPYKDVDFQAFLYACAASVKSLGEASNCVDSFKIHNDWADSNLFHAKWDVKCCSRITKLAKGIG